jgi:hypothetical protein
MTSALCSCEGDVDKMDKIFFADAKLASIQFASNMVGIANIGTVNLST